MKKWFFVLIFTFLNLCILPGQRIVEKVDVTWQTVPFYALDQSGKAINSLSKDQIQLFLNRKKIENFVVIKNQTISSDLQKLQINQKNRNIFNKGKVVFLVFDTRGSLQEIKWSKNVAQSIVKNLPESTTIAVMSIDPLFGLKLISDPIKDKKELINDFIEQKIRKVTQPFGIPFMYKNYLSCLRSLSLISYIYYNENVHIYIFSRSLLVPPYLINWWELKKTAHELIKSGTIFHVINTTSDFDRFPHNRSIDILRYLENKIGGKYIYGNQEKVLTELKELKNAYFEIAFPVPKNFRDDSNKIKIKSNIPGIKILAVNEIFKEKGYADMNRFEKKLMALSILESGNWSKAKFKTYISSLKNSIEKKYQISKITLPEAFKGQTLDLFKIWINEDKSDTKIDFLSVNPTDIHMEVKAKKKKGYDLSLVLINQKQEIAFLAI